MKNKPNDWKHKHSERTQKKEIHGKKQIKNPNELKNVSGGATVGQTEFFL